MLLIFAIWMNTYAVVGNLSETKIVFLFYCSRRVSRLLKEFLEFLLGRVRPHLQLYQEL